MPAPELPRPASAQEVRAGRAAILKLSSCQKQPTQDVASAHPDAVDTNDQTIIRSSQRGGSSSKNRLDNVSAMVPDAVIYHSNLCVHWVRYSFVVNEARPQLAT